MPDVWAFVSHHPWVTAGGFLVSCLITVLAVCFVNALVEVCRDAYEQEKRRV